MNSNVRDMQRYNLLTAILIFGFISLVFGLLGMISFNQYLSKDSELYLILPSIGAVLLWPSFVFAFCFVNLGVDPDNFFSVFLYVILSPVINVYLYLGLRKILKSLTKRFT